MNLAVFIVENEQADSRKLVAILEQAGHLVLGYNTIHSPIANYFSEVRPDIILLNAAAGFEEATIKLATDLEEKHIPFILTAAAYTPVIRQIVKKVNPHGFLTKPLSDHAVVAALEIAAYRSNIGKAMLQRQEKWLETLLLNILESPGSKPDKLLSLVKAFASFVPFDYLVIDTDLQQRDPVALYSYQRIGFNEYHAITGADCIKACKVTVDEFFALRRFNGLIKKIDFVNDSAFIDQMGQTAYGEKVLKTQQFRSRIWVPVYNNNKLDMGLAFYSMSPDCYNESHAAFMRSFQKVLSAVLLNIRGGQRKNNKNISINAECKPAPTSLVNPTFEGVIGKSLKLAEALDQAIQVAPFDSSVLVLGETGVGKEGLVRAIHNHSGRRNGPFVRVNCAAIAATLIESELFGFEKGSFTGATDQRPGKFEQANGGTLFLDEIAELSQDAQSKLLRVLQEREIDRIGGRETIKINVRVIAATNKDLLAEVAKGKFRMDLYYRINVFPITLPPLRERKEDIPELADYFLKRFNPYHNAQSTISKSALKQLQSYTWPGNVRELEHLIERHVLTSKTGSIDHFDMPEALQLYEKPVITGADFKPIAQIDKEYILAVLRKCNGKVSGKNGAAALLKLPPTTLNSKMKKLGIRWPSNES
jgi:transcriptional regulator with GAF, ATPase, and Fis domain/AmiR/NasT family two-component response regulator